ncbi:Serine/threonine-protein kinase pkn1 [Maioricimonas rarisocia]|uniref:Serine/threonine-protein kinase pkn1 n=1 Tax=Maioricimonas rarisocia TaxID=2528026 RepID=A0A517Z9I3_9PLAN|nr:formylglycine-generating enzyme family protein [Maioricimonas rarisocia]QDU39101.1 Serine/threonine-protein kinase pkn1 [Maioricimonas rarisocia]
MRYVMICAAVLFSMVTVHPLAADDTASRAQLLETFMQEFVTITPGKGPFPATFEMGSGDGPASEQPVHDVRLQAAFRIAKYEVPQNLYAAVMGENPSRWKGPRNSAEMMTWQEANEFCAKVTSLLREANLIDETETVRLPTEAEWEYCCRAGTTTAYSFGEEAQAADDAGTQASRLDPYGWHTGNAAGNDPPVGALKPNAWGLHDMHGYLWEFCSDAWHADYEGAPTDGSSRPAAEGKPTQIVIRGGSWKDRYPRLRCAARQSFAVDGRDDAVGFRCVLVKRER